MVRATRGIALMCSPRGNPFQAPPLPVSLGVGLPTMAINGAWNKRCGPGGGTRRLHQLSRREFRRVSRGRNRIDARSKDVAFARHGTTDIGPYCSCE